jgi:hypothetical protein
MCRVRTGRISDRRKVLSLALLTSLAGTAGLQQAIAASAPPVFTPTAEAAWVGIGTGAFAPVPGWPSPVVQDPAHRYVPNNTPGEQPTQRISDVSNPNLKQWAKDVMKKDNDEVLAGKFAFTARAACKPGGVPGFLVLLAPGALTILQQPGKVTMIVDGNAETRHIRLNAAHDLNAKPSWYGDSVGHYEGDTLVIDTIGLNDKTFLDNFRTPHSEKLHVTERWRLIENAAKIEVLLTIDDPDTFNAPFKMLRQYERVNRTFAEYICAENNSANLFDYGTPRAERPDF